MKKMYQNPELQVVLLENVDIVTDSFPVDDDL